MAGAEVAQLYLTNDAPEYPAPRWALAGFERVDVAPGASATVVFQLPALGRSEVREEDYERWVLPASLTLWVGGGQPSQEPRHTTANALKATLKTTGAATALTACQA